MRLFLFSLLIMIVPLFGRDIVFAQAGGTLSGDPLSLEDTFKIGRVLRVSEVSGGVPAALDGFEAVGIAFNEIYFVYLQDTDSHYLGMRYPQTSILVGQPAGGRHPVKINGNFEFFSEWKQESESYRVGIALPIYEGSADPANPRQENQALSIANAGDGWYNQELYNPGRLPITLTARISNPQKGGFEAHGEGKLSIMPTLGLLSSEAEEVTINPIAIAVVIGGTLGYSGDLFAVEMRLWTVAQPVLASVSGDTEPIFGDTLIEPQFTVKFLGFAMSLGIIGSIAGELELFGVGLNIAYGF